MKRLILVVALSLVGQLMAYPTRCPFVDMDTGLPCLGVPMPAGMSVAGSIYECSYGHRWVERN